MRYLKHKWDTDEYQRTLHIADAQGRPLCRNGGMNMRSWNLVDIAEPQQGVCGSCRRVLKAQEANEGV